MRTLILGGWVAGLIWWERRRALRRTIDNKLERDIRNLGVAASTGLVMQLLESPIAYGLAKEVEQRRWGLLRWMPISAARIVIGIVLLDYTLYLWHVLTHRVPLLWRFHQVHHIDREMDATTALRFHFGEIALSIGFRAAQILIVGPGPATVAALQMFLFASILFHHANVRLPVQWERRLARIIVTPRLHGIHHSIVAEEVNSNWSSGFSVWDWLHGTLRTEARQEEIVIGVAGRRGDSDQRLGRILALPFTDHPELLPMPGGPVRQSIAALQ